MNVHCNVGITILFLFIIYILFIYPACVRFLFFLFDSICFLSSEFIHVNWHMVMKNIYCSSSKTVKSEEKKIYFSFLWRHLSVSAGAPPWTSNPPMSDRESVSAEANPETSQIKTKQDTSALSRWSPLLAGL